jgi:beta-barrel assembly-enhancing protease
MHSNDTAATASQVQPNPTAAPGVRDWQSVTPNPTSWQGSLTDGRSAASYPVEITFAPSGLSLSWPGAQGPATAWAYDTLATAEPIRTTSTDTLITTRTAAGATLFVNDPQFATQLALRAPHTSLKAARLAGLRPGAMAGAAAFSLAAGIWAFDLSPSKEIARLMPDAARQKLATSVLASMPVTKTCTDTDGVAALDSLVKRLGATGKVTSVAVLDWGLMNAFAAPGGHVVLTRAIIEKASNPDEIAGVLAHEIGHSLELHPEAGLVRSVGFWALIQMVFTGTPGALGNAGTVLAQLAYTRSYEREADAIALKLLKEAGISHRPFAGFFKRMDGKEPVKPTTSKRGIFSNDMLQTHPPTAERIRTIEAQPDYPATPALTAVQWQALRKICGGATASRPTGVVTDGTDIKPVPPKSTDRLKEADARVASAPNDALSYQLRGDIHLGEKRFAEAVADFTQAIALAPTAAIHPYNRGRAYHNWAKHDEAVADYTEALKLNPKYPMALAARAAVYRVQTKPDLAFKDLDAALAINSRLEYGLYQRGILNASVSKWAESESDFSKVIELNKTYAYAYARRGWALEKMNQRDKAIADYRLALLASPSSSNAADAFKFARDQLKALGATEKP